MAEERVQRRLAAILAADVVGYSRLMGEDGARTRIPFNDQRDRLIKPSLDRHYWRFRNMSPQLNVTDQQIRALIRYVRELQRANGNVFRRYRM